ncbi:YqjK-like family protein [Erwinia sp. PK3-005]|uniref:YqjK-like family protein n=1 Tax=Mixta hanseatica TaxID=2872648 RepID=A0ABY4R613_9GAMM|nr:YqjK-like family protein [Mixta hanseatica]UQY43668.1 YqjK-like family protein [Mixta hanseatica]
MTRADREQRKADLLITIHQQRLDLSMARREWLLETARYDRGWMTLLSLRSYLAIGSSALAIWSVRNPNFLMRWAKRGVGAWSTWRLIKSNLPRKH